MIGYTSNNHLNERKCFNPFKRTAKHDDGGQGKISMVPLMKFWLKMKMKVWKLLGAWTMCIWFLSKFCPFLAPTGDQKVTLSVCPCGTSLCRALNLHLSVSYLQAWLQDDYRMTTEWLQDDLLCLSLKYFVLLMLYLVYCFTERKAGNCLNI